jgi:hypothetical protein
MQFQTAIAGGTDWRGVTRSLLLQIPNIRQYNFGILYVTDELAEQAASIFTLLRRISKIPHWTGGSNLAAFSNAGYLHGEPGAVLMLAKLPPGSVSQPDSAMNHLRENPMPFGWLHGDPRMLQLPRNLQTLTSLPTFWVGGLLLNRGGHHAFAGQMMTDDAMTLCCFNETISVATTIFQGCEAFGKIHTVTSADGSMLIGLDHRPAIEIFANDTAALVSLSGEGVLQRDDIHIGIINSKSDQGDYAVRGLSSIDPKQEFLNIAANLDVGQKIQFVRRHKKFAHDHMHTQLDELTRRIKRQGKRPVAAHYVSCMGRVPGLFNDQTGEEMDYLRAALGNIPIIGYYGIGEIMRGELHNFAGVLTVFLE